MSADWGFVDHDVEEHSTTPNLGNGIGGIRMSYDDKTTYEEIRMDREIDGKDESNTSTRDLPLELTKKFAQVPKAGRPAVLEDEFTRLIGRTTRVSVQTPTMLDDFRSVPVKKLSLAWGECLRIQAEEAKSAIAALGDQGAAAVQEVEFEIETNGAMEGGAQLRKSFSANKKILLLGPSLAEASNGKIPCAYTGRDELVRLLKKGMKAWK